jgi:Afadin- and alpha -actinin-Binding
MDAQNLETASHYVNNLLLSRGLLRNGDPIDFTKSTSKTTAASIINLVHDLVLRKDVSVT